MSNKELIQNLKLFRDKAFCHHSHSKAYTIFRKIAKNIPKPYITQIQTEWSHVQLGHGFEQACGALNTEIEKCIKHLKGVD